MSEQFIGSEIDSQIRYVLAKQGSQRSYDDLLILKSRISQMDFMKSVFSSLHPRQVDELCRSMNLEIYEENQFVFHQGDVGDKFYVVLSGSCDILLKQRTGNFITDSEGNKVEEYTHKVIFTCKAGGQFGERALDYDEPRAASIMTTCCTELITITQAAYRKMLKAPIYETPLDQPGNKGHTLRVLSLTRDKRKANELHAVSEYLSSHVPFFKKFSKDQRLEICRMCELVKVWGKTVLFKQGSVGQAFYIILTGSVDVIVTSSDVDGESIDIHVNTLHEGASFGERALEAEDSLRTASIVTSEALTELIIISREEYKRIVAVMRQGDMMERVQLLRKTQIFGGLELPYLHDIAKIMDSKVFRLDSTLFSLDEPAKDVFIIHKGECHLDCLMQMENGNSEIVDLGRVGPGAVLGEYCLMAESYYDEVLFKETAVATTYCCAFVLSKIDFFNTVSPETRTVVIDAIRQYVPPSTFLWDMSPHRLSERDWRISQTWKNFQSEVAFRKKPKGILEHLQNTNKKSRRMGESCSEVLALGNMSASHHSLFSPRHRGSRTLESSVDTPPQQSRSELSPRVSSSDKQGSSPSRSSRPLKRYYSVVGKLSPGRSQDASMMLNSSLGGRQHAAKGAHQKGELGTNTSLQQLPFALIQIHRDSIKLHSAKDVRRSLKCFIRFCGSMSSGAEAKAAAEAQMLNLEIKLLTSKNPSAVAEDTTSRGNRTDVIEWRRFNGFENMQLQHTDHFIVMCRSVPVESASFSPSCDLMDLVFPPSCKLKAQKYCCVTINDLKRTAPLASNSAKAEMEDALTPLYTREISCVSEVHAVTHTKIESLRFAVLALNPANQAPNTSLLVVPLYTWQLISEEMINEFSCSEYTASVVKDAENRRHRGADNGDVEHSKSATEELRIALQGFGVGAMKYNIPGNRDIDDNMSVSHEASSMLKRDIHAKTVMDEVNRRIHNFNALKQLKVGQQESSNIPSKDDAKTGGRNRNKYANNIVEEPEKTTAEIEAERRAAIASVISARANVIRLNDELCMQERDISLSMKEKGLKLFGVGSVSGSKRHSKKLPLEGNVGKQRVDVLEALQSAPVTKNMKIQSEAVTLKSLNVAPQKGGYGSSNSNKDSPAERRGNRCIVPYLKHQLDILDEIMFNNSVSQPPGEDVA
mmetsp:Transcript_25131/g.37034  ORF Transcript_25131/g.37034 Transcript_25131/m.37034 type:complete len:1156 (+) Transcript_25131:136-3603(+)